MNSETPANVLLVDDRPDNLLAMQSVLGDLKQNLICASSAREALKQLLITDVALILLDVQMPGLNGFELAELIREREKTQHTPIIFVSATSVDEQYIFKGYALGAVDYLTKPINSDILKSKVMFFTRLYQQNQEIKHQAQLLEEANTELDESNAKLEVRVLERTAELEAANQKLEAEIATRAESEARLAIEHAVTRTLAESDNLDEAAPTILRAFISNLDAEICALWLLDGSETSLVCSQIETRKDAVGLDRFIEESRMKPLVPGSGLPGTVWEQNGPVWISHAMTGDQYPRASIASASGLQSSVGFPLKIGSSFIGVIEFYTRRVSTEDKSFVNMLEAIGSEIGQFVQRKRLEEDREALLLREKALRLQAEEASRIKDEFLATVSHELRTPLNSILGWGQILSTTELSDGDRRNALETIYRNAKSQSRLIDDLLDTSRLITGNIHLHLAPTDVVPILQAAVDVVHPTASSKQVNISTRFSQEPETVTCDPQRLQQMVWNLLTNAVKFTPSGGSVEIALDRVDDILKISVTDTGTGIPAEFLPRVFERFSQVDSSSTRTHDGLGLGLAIVRHLAELHGGAVSVESEGLGKGSTFSINLPLANVVGRPTSASAESNGKPAANTADSSLQGIRILVVDDDEDSCNMVRFALQMSGAEVSVSGSVADAIVSLNKSSPDVLLADINMPDEDGYSLIRKIRGMGPGKLADVPAVALTAMARSEDTERVLNAGFQRHITKPVEIEELTATIAELVGR